jgi:putative flippase GtrA
LPAPARGAASWARERLVIARASISSLAATAVDAAAYQLVLFSDLGDYRAAAVCGALLGAVTNFTLNRAWAFPPSGRSLRWQAVLYAGASLLTLLGLQASLAVCVEALRMDEHLAWVPSKIAAWLFVSYPLFRCVVFAPPRGQEASGGHETS